MTETKIGLDRRTARVAGTVAVIVVIATAMVVEPRLQASGYGYAALGIYAVSVPVLVWSIIEDVRRMRT